MNGRRITDVACPMIAPPGRVAATRLRCRGTCNPPLMVCAHQVNELGEHDTGGGLSEYVSDHHTPGEVLKCDHLACNKIAKKNCAPRTDVHDP